MQRRGLALWLVICIVFLSVPMDGLCAIARANTVVSAEKATAGEVVAGGMTYTINSDGESVTLSSVSDNSITDLEVPSTVSVSDVTYRVTAVKYRAFYNNKILQTVQLPEGLETVNGEAFKGCTALETVVFPSTITEINYSAFEGCEKLSDVKLPTSLESLGYHAFKGCASLTSIEIPKTLSSVSGLTNASPFVGCDNLAEITFESGIVKVPGYMFKNLKTLTNIEIPDGVEEIGAQAFYNCIALKDVSLPESLKTINGEAFQGCTALETVVLPSAITKINYCAFEGCEKLSDVKLPASLESLGYHAFKGCVSLVSIEIPKTLASVSGLTSTSPFVGCDNLAEITFESGMTKIPSYMFKNFTTLKKIVIPDGVTEIGTEAFRNCKELKEVVLPEGLKTIRSEAFYGCEALPDIYIPHTVTTIATGVFNDASNVVVHANKDSHATVYAIDNNIDFYWVGNTLENEEEDCLDRTMCQYLTDAQSSVNGYISYQIDYGFKATTTVSAMKISVYIPDNVTLVESSITEDGVISTDYTISGKVLTIPVSKTTGRIKYKVKQEDQKPCYSYATIRYYRNKTYYTEVIGATKAELMDLSLEMDEETDTETFRISGVALPGKEVAIYLDDVWNSTVTASKAGVYQADVTISLPVNYKTYEVKVLSKNTAGEEVSVEEKITFIPGVPKLETFIMQHNGQEYSLTKLNGLKPIVTFRDGCEFSFEVSFENDDQIDEVYFVSTRNNVEKKMKAVRDEGTGTYQATGFFDASNKNYVPGTITVEYIRRGEISYFDGNVDFSAEKYVNSLPEEFSGATADVVTNTENELNAVITFPELDNSQVEISVTTSDIPAELTLENAEQYGYQRVGGAQMASALSREGISIDRTETPATLFFKEVENEVTGQIEAQLLDFAEGKIKSVSGYGQMIDLYNNYGTVMEWMETGVTYKENRLKIKEAKEAVQTSDWSSEEKAAALDHLETAQILNNKKVALQVAATIIAVAGVANPTLSFMIGAMSFFTDYRLEASMLDVNSLVSKVSGSAQINFRWAIDPSGYVYDADSLERLSGVTVTLYYKETEGSAPVLWDASEYLQLNPLTTAADGTYAWDVPEGLWQVKAEKEGYVTTSSEWLPVPPPQTEVNLAMKKIDSDVNDGGENDGGENDSDSDIEEDDDVTPEKPVVTPPVKVGKITLGGISKKIAAGKKIRLTATVLPSNAANKAIVWTSSNTKYATVSSAGMVSVKKAGIGKNVTITATAKDGSGVKATYKIKIMKHKVTGVSLKASKKTVKAGKSVTVKATVKANGKKVNKTLKWTSSNTKYATVTKKGVVKTKKAGKGKTVTITATSTDGTNKKAKIKIKIK